MLKVEKELRTRLTNHEKDMLNSGFQITDIVWGRIIKEKALIKVPQDISNFYYDLHYYLKILNSNKDFMRSLICSVMIFKFDSSGLDVYSLDSGEIKYHTPERSVIVTTGIQYIYKHRKYIELESANKELKKSDTLLKNILPFSYLNNSELLFVFNDLYDRYSHNNYSLRNLIDYTPKFDFSKKVDFLKAKGWLHEEEIEKTWDEIFKELDEME